MDAATQQGLSQRYAALQVCVVPTPEGLVLFSAYGSRRTLIDIFPSWEEIGEWYEGNFAASLASSEREASRRAPKPQGFDPLASFSL